MQQRLEHIRVFMNRGLKEVPCWISADDRDLLDRLPGWDVSESCAEDHSMFDETPYSQLCESQDRREFMQRLPDGRRDVCLGAGSDSQNLSEMAELLAGSQPCHAVTVDSVIPVSSSSNDKTRAETLNSLPEGTGSPDHLTLPSRVDLISSVSLIPATKLQPVMLSVKTGGASTSFYKEECNSLQSVEGLSIDITGSTRTTDAGQSSWSVTQGRGVASNSANFRNRLQEGALPPDAEVSKRLGRILKGDQCANLDISLGATEPKRGQLVAESDRVVGCDSLVEPADPKRGQLVAESDRVVVCGSLVEPAEPNRGQLVAESDRVVGCGSLVEPADPKRCSTSALDDSLQQAIQNATGTACRAPNETGSIVPNAGANSAVHIDTSSHIKSRCAKPPLIQCGAPVASLSVRLNDRTAKAKKCAPTDSFEQDLNESHVGSAIYVDTCHVKELRVVVRDILKQVPLLLDDGSTDVANFCARPQAYGADEASSSFRAQNVLDSDVTMDEDDFYQDIPSPVIPTMFSYVADSQPLADFDLPHAEERVWKEFILLAHEALNGADNAAPISKSLERIKGVDAITPKVTLLATEERGTTRLEGRQSHPSSVGVTCKSSLLVPTPNSPSSTTSVCLATGLIKMDSGFLGPSRLTRQVPSHSSSSASYMENQSRRSSGRSSFVRAAKRKREDTEQFSDSCQHSVSRKCSLCSLHWVSSSLLNSTFFDQAKKVNLTND